MTLPGTTHRRLRFVTRIVMVFAAAVMATSLSGYTAPVQSGPPASACGLQTTDRIVAIGDIHGAYDQFVAILREAGLIDQKLRWTGGHAVFVQTGDVLDRGADSRKALDLIRRLEPDAAKAGGRVVPLLGNHEGMRMLGVLRDTSAGEYAAFRSAESPDLLERYYAAVLPSEKARAAGAGQPFDERAFHKTFLDKTPAGAVEMQLAFAPDGEYGRWLRTHDTIAIINGIAFLHGGTTPAVAALGCAEVNSKVRAELQTLKLSDPAFDKSLLFGADGPLWYRGLVAEPPEVDSDALDGILRSLHVTSMVVAHTVAPGGRMRATFGGRVIQIDTGMLGGSFYSGGAPSALEIQGNTFTAIYLGKREPIARSPATSHSARR